MTNITRKDAESVGAFIRTGAVESLASLLLDRVAKGIPELLHNIGSEQLLNGEVKLSSTKPTLNKTHSTPRPGM